MTCWVFVRARFGQFMYGLYPPPERWRVDLAGLVLVVSIAALAWKALPYRRVFAVAALLILPPLGIWLLGGGFVHRLQVWARQGNQFRARTAFRDRFFKEL